MKKNLLPEAVVVIAVLMSPIACLGDTAACPPNKISESSKKAASLLDYLAERGPTAAASVAECALVVYRSVNTVSMVRSSTHRFEQLVQEVGNIQKSASQSLREAGDIDGAVRFDRQEIFTRKTILSDIQQFDDDIKRQLRSERIRQLTYLTQALIRQDDGLQLHEVLAGAELELLQGQVISAWVMAAASCPSWKISLAGGVSDTRLKSDVCSASCRGPVKFTLDAVSNWKEYKKQDWGKIGQAGDLTNRMKSTLKSCPKN